MLDLAAERLLATEAWLVRVDVVTGADHHPIKASLTDDVTRQIPDGHLPLAGPLEAVVRLDTDHLVLEGDVLLQVELLGICLQILQLQEI